MGWGNPQPIVQLKRQAAQSARETARADKAERELRLLRADLDRLLTEVDEDAADGELRAIKAFVVRAALVPRQKCPGCQSPFAFCPVHR